MPDTSGRPGLAVVLSVRGLGRGGAERLVFRETEAVKAAGLPVEVWYQVAGEFVPELAHLGVPTRVINLRNARRHLRRLTASHDRVVVHTHSPSLGALLRFASAGLRRVRFIHTEHNLVSSYRPGTRAAHRLTASRIDELVAVSRAVLESAPSVPSRRVLYHADMATERMQACLGLRFKEEGPLRVLCVASLTSKKDHGNLLRALEGIDSSAPGPISVGIVGDGPTRDEVDALARQVNERCSNVSVELLGVRDDVPDLMRDADVLVLPSRSEGLPLIVMEAMAGSTPVVATAVGGVPELIEDGHTGLLVPPADPLALQGALDRVLRDRDLRRSLARSARAAVLELTTSSWTDEYLGMLGAPATGPSRQAH